jgi:DNA-binding LytR/AlgR family response regulator
MTTSKKLDASLMAGSMKIMLASNTAERLAPLATGLWNQMEPELFHAESCSEVLDLLTARAVELVVIDEDLADMKGVQLARMLAEKHPFVNCMLVSSLPADEFHEVTEGLGVLMQLASPPDMDAASTILLHLSEIKGFLAA